MVKKLLSLVIAAFMLAAIAVPAVAADVTVMTAPTKEDYTVLRGYSGEKGSYSTSGNKLNLNGSGVVAAANKIVWDPAQFTGEAGIVFTVTYNEAYTALSDVNTDGNYFENYRFAVALMDSQNFQGNAEGNGLGVEFRLVNKTGNIRAMGLYYDGEKDLGIKYPNRNKTTAMNAEAGRAVKCKITWNGGWKIWVDNDGDGVIDSLVAAFNPAEAWEVDNNNVGQYFPTDLLKGGEGFLVFGAYNGKATNMSISIDQLYGGFTFGDKVVIRDNDGINDPALFGAQIRKNEGGSFDVRFVSELSSIEYGAVGFKYNLERWSESNGTVVDGSHEKTGWKTAETHLAYKAINYTDGNGTLKQLSAKDGSYFSAFAIEGFELTDKTDIVSGTIVPFAIGEDGKEYYGTAYTVVITDGNSITFTPID